MATGSEDWWQVGDRDMISSLELAGEVSGVDATVLVQIWGPVAVAGDAQEQNEAVSPT